MRLNFIKAFASRTFRLASLVAIKTLFQVILLASGLRWLSADDYSRTVISWDWLQSPRIYSGVWLSLHFWLNGIFIWIFRDLVLAPVLMNTLFSIFTLVFFYLLVEKLFNDKIAFLSSLIFAVFPFQVWLSLSGMPESAFFFFIMFSCCCYVLWYEGLKKNETRTSLKFLALSAASLNFSNLLRYEGWLFSMALIILVIVLTFRERGLSKALFVNFSVSAASLVTVLWWLYQNNIDYGDPLYFMKETTRYFENLNPAGFWQRVIQYPFFVVYIAPATTALGAVKVFRTVMNKKGRDPANGGISSPGFLKIFLLFNIVEMLLLMLTGIFGSGGTSLISRYVVMNSILLFPFAVWQLLDFRKYILVSSFTAIILINIVWSFYFQQAYREDTYETANLVKKLIQKNYFAGGGKVYFEQTEGYFDIYALQVISNSPGMFNNDTIPSAFPANIPVKKSAKKKSEDERQKMNILALRKFLEERNIKLFIARSDLLIDKLKKLSNKSEQIGDYYVFYISEDKVKYKKGGFAGTNHSNGQNAEVKNSLSPNVISFGKKMILKEFRIDNSNFGLNPQTVIIKWQIADVSVLDSLASEDDEYGRYKVRVELAPDGKDTTVYDAKTNVFSERNVEEFFESEEFRNILILKPFALLNYSKKLKLSPFESGLYDIRLSLLDEVSDREIPVFRGDSVFVYPDAEAEGLDTSASDYRQKLARLKKMREFYSRSPFYPLGKVIAIFPNVDYTAILKSSKELSQLIIRNGLMLPVLQRYQGDQFLNVVFNYF